MKLSHNTFFVLLIYTTHLKDWLERTSCLESQTPDKLIAACNKEQRVPSGHWLPVINFLSICQFIGVSQFMNMAAKLAT